MKQCYRDINFQAATLRTIDEVNTIVRRYQAQGFMLSVRQIYYQLVAADKIPNTDRSYKNLASIINDGRLAGLIDWDAIEDRNRDIAMRTRWDSPLTIVKAAADSYHMDMWDNQSNRVFVIVEKAALAGILDRVCKQHDVPLLAARGYPSVSIVREMMQVHMLSPMLNGRDCTVLHLGDHDPSGIDMTRDLQDRFNLFSDGTGHQVTVERIALTMRQIEETDPPPNPAKVTDSRFASYMQEYGAESWELDALEPAYLVDLVENWIGRFKDDEAWGERSDEVERLRAKLRKVESDFRKGNL